MTPIRVTVWNEFRHEKNQDAIRKIYPEGIHNALAAGLAAEDLAIRTATLDEPRNGLPPEVVDNTDVLIWWGHCAHAEVADEVVARVHKRVLEGMGLIVLHSGHFSKIFRAVSGTSCSLKWREAGEKERLWNIDPAHPIMRGVGEYFELPHEEMYGERFDIPAEAHTLMIGWFEGGEVFRSAVTFPRGYGKVFYFQPGHESYPNYYDPNVLRIIGNAVRFLKPAFFREMSAPNAPARETIRTVSDAPVSGIVQNLDGTAK